MDNEPKEMIVYSSEKEEIENKDNSVNNPSITQEEFKAIKKKIDEPITKEEALAQKKKAFFSSESNDVKEVLFEEEENDEEEDDPSDCLERRVGVKVKDVILIFTWIVLGFSLIYYIYSSVTTYVKDRHKPATNVAFSAKSALSFPAVTICNWNTGDDPINEIDLHYCFHSKENDSTHDQCQFPITKKKIISGGEVFSCLVLNNDTSSPLIATKTGYLGTISVIVDINTTVKPGKIRSVGVQVTFHNIGDTAKDMLLNETKCATPNYDNNFSITKVERHTIRPTPMTKTFWISSHSAVELVKQTSNKIMVSFSYKTLNIQKVTEYEASNWLQLLGEVSGMASTLYGFGFVMVWRTCLWLPIAFKKKSIKVVWEELNN